MIFLTSDTHFDDERSLTFRGRPYADVETMNEAMVETWNSLIAPGDDVFHLGDFAVTEDAIEKYAPRLNGNIRLMIGNHDYNKDRGLLHDCFYEVMEEPSEVVLGTMGQPVNQIWLCHYPVQRHETLFCCCGHVHELWTVARNMINVSMDSWHMKPISLETVLDYKGRQERGSFDANVYPDADIEFRREQTNLRNRVEWEPTKAIIEAEWRTKQGSEL